MPVTKLKIISDIELQLTQGAPSDDLNLEPDQIAYWLQDVLNEMKRKEIIAEKKEGRGIPPIYVRREVGLNLEEENITGISAVNQRMFLELAGEVLDLPNDAGVVNVLDYDLNSLNKTTLEDLHDTKDLRFAKPSPSNVLHYRDGKKIFIVGLNTADIEYNPFIVDYVVKQNILEMADDDEVLISDQLVNIVKEEVIRIGKLQLYGTQVDENNDGVDSKEAAYHLMINNPTEQSK